MTNYPVKLTHRSHLTVEELAVKARTAFGSSEVRDGVVTASYGALSRLTVRPVGKDLGIETSMDPKVGVDVAAETVRRYNRFLEDATGFTSKERAKRLRKSSQGPAPGS